MNAHPRLVALVLSLSLSTLPACASGNWSGLSTSIGPESNLLCSSELGATRFSTLYEAIQVLRPRFLRGRSQGTHPPVAYVDGSRTHDLEVLHGMSPRAIMQVLYLSAADATTRFGTGHDGGALLVSTDPGRTSSCGH